MPRREVSTDGKEPSKTSFDLGGSEIYLQEGINGRAYAGHGEPNLQCYESSLGTKRTSLHKWVHVSVIFSAQISRWAAMCATQFSGSCWWKGLLPFNQQTMNVKMDVMFQHVCYTVRNVDWKKNSLQITIQAADMHIKIVLHVHGFVWSPSGSTQTKMENRKQSGAHMFVHDQYHFFQIKT